jgi:hypothetical protein
VLALFALALLVFTKDEPASWADGSRLGTVQAIVEHGTLALDATDYLWQGDRVRFGEHHYSHQPPMLALAASVPYAFLHHVLGRAIDAPFTYRVLTWLTVGLPLLLGLRELARLFLRAGCSAHQAAVLLLLAAFCTLAFPFALVLNQHGAAAGLAMIGLGLVARGRPLLAGVALSAATTVDLTAVFLAVSFAWPVLRGGGIGALVSYALGALPLVSLHLGMNLGVAGDVLPFGLHAEAFRYPYSPFLLMSLTGELGEEAAGTQALYAFHALLGRSGLFSHHPLLLLSVAAGIALALRPRSADDSEREGLPPGLLPAVAAGSLGIVAFYLVSSRNFGGSAFGMRWFAVFSPLMLLFPAAWLGRREEPPGLGLRALALVLALWSLGASALGAVQPWTKFQYTWLGSPAARIADPGVTPPTTGEHLRSEFRRVSTWRQPFDRSSYVTWYADLVYRFGYVRLRETPGLSEEARVAWIRRDLPQLEAVADELESAGDRSAAHAAARFWLAKLLARVGELERARAEVERCIELRPANRAAHELAERLREQR